MKNLFLRVTMTLALVAMGFSAFAQSTVKGTVKDAAGEPIIGAAVQVAGTHNGAITDLDGSFSLPGVYQGDKLEVSCIGYAGQTIAWNGGVVNFVLEEDAELLEGTVVTALGIRKDEKKVGYAVSSVSAESLNATVAPSLGSALYGKASGVRISTAPGGATGSISINVRGLSSITGTNQPLIVVDGVPIRNGEANNQHFWDENRIQSNGLADINVEDIENLTILKGASATSLYGSEGANGVVLITMKKGKKNSGIHVDFNASVQGDFVAYMPVYQTTYGPGARHRAWATSGYTEEGFVERKDKDGNTVLGVASASAYFGPKYDGRQVYHYDGTMHSYNAYSAHPWNDVFRTGLTQQYNLAVTAGHEHGNLRFSYTFMDNLPNQYNSHLGKHNFSLTGSQDITSNGAVKLGYSVSYLKENIKNRPFKLYDVVSSFSGMFGAFDNVAWVREHTVTSAGYRNRVYSESNHENPAEGWAYGLPFGNLVNAFFWNIYGREQFEDHNRLIASVTPSWQIIPGLTLKGSIATDYTGEKIELNEHMETASVFGGTSGNYVLTNRTYQTIYGDALLNFNKTFGKFGIDANVGYSARNESMIMSKVRTDDGLSVENWFHINASNKPAKASMGKSEFLKQAIFATASVSYGDWAYLEGTIRNETVSTLYPGKNSFWYPSVNASVIFSELLNMPSWVDYAKVRASYGVVGNAPELYKAPLSYNQNNASGYIYNTISNNLGNDSIRPEITKEWEFGLEGKFFKNRAGFELSYYHKRISDQILEATAPQSSGGSSVLMNVGELTNQGVEFSAYGTIIENRDWRFDVSGNIAWNTNRVVKLAEGMDVLEHLDMDGSKAAYLRSYVGQKMGDIYTYDLKKDDNGNFIIDDDPNSDNYGFQILTDEMVKVGNAMPDLIGGFAFSLAYKRFTLDANFNFQIGGDVLNVPYEYMMGRGSLVESMKYRDAEHGGLSYYIDGNVLVPTDAAAGPAGQKVYHDGMILPGVRASDGKPNDIILDSETYYNWTYNWGPPDGGPTYYAHAVFKNTYLKCRELALSYTLPNNLTKKFGCNNLRLSVFARNPFYVYKNMPIFDVEASDATNWIRQSVLQGSTASTRTFGFSLRANF